MIVLGIDPGIADGKPYAMVAVETGVPRAVGVCDTLEPMGGSLSAKYRAWQLHLVASILRFRPELVAVEDARGVGGKGSGYLMALVRLLCDWCEEEDVAWVLVHPAKAKAAVLAGNQGSDIVCRMVRMLVQGADQLQETADHDYESACAIALAGAAKWRENNVLTHDL